MSKPRPPHGEPDSDTFERLAAGDLPPDINPAALGQARAFVTLVESAVGMPDGGDPGEVVWGHYRVVETIGRGGGGVVFLAVDARTGRRVAVKSPRPEALLDPEAHARLLNEAAALRRLDHPHIVSLLDAGEADGVPYFARPYIDGESLADLLRRGGPMPPSGAAALARSLADAADHAHRRGVLHCDIKPGNVLIDPAGVPHVIDFGLAAVRGEETGMTQSGIVVGTPAYMSPEQAAGRPEGVTAQSDVWALGVILYEALTGGRPFPGGTSAEVLHGVTRLDPPRPRSHAPSVPRRLEAVVLKCLEKDAARRYGSARELRDDLDAWLAGRRPAARTLGPFRCLARWVRRRPVAAALAGSAALLIVVAFAFGFGLRAATLAADAAGADAQAARRAEAAARSRELVARCPGRERSGRPGWVAVNLADLREAARLRPPAADLPRLRTEAAATLAGVDVERGEIARKFTPHQIAWSPDGKSLALGQYIRSRSLIWPAAYDVRLVDPESGRRRTALRAPADTDWEGGLISGRWDGSRALAFSPDGRLLASGGRGGAVAVWDMSEAEPEPAIWKALDRSVGALAFGPGGRTLYTLTGSRVRRWEENGGRWAAAGECVASAAKSVVPDPRGRWVAFRGPKAIQFMKPDLSGPARPPVPDLSIHSRAAFNAANGLLAVGGERITLLDPAQWDGQGTRRRNLTIPGRRIAHEHGLGSLTFSPAGKFLVSVSEHGNLARLWDVASGRCLLHWGTAPNSSGRAAFSPDGRQLAVTRERGVGLWTVRRPAVCRTVALGPQPVLGMGIAAGGAVVLTAVGGPDGKLRFAMKPGPWPTRDGVTVTEALKMTDKAAFAVGPNGRRAAWRAGPDGAILFGPDGVSPLPRMKIKDMQFGPDGRLWVSDSAGKVIRLFGAEGKQVTVSSRVDPIAAGKGVDFTRLAVGRDWALAGRRDGVVTALRADDATFHARYAVGGRGPVTALSIRGDLAAAGLADGTVVVFDARSGEAAAGRPRPHDGPVTSVGFIGGVLFTAGEDGRVGLWRGGDEILSLRQTGPVRRAAYEPVTATLYVMMDHECGVRAWDLAALRRELRELGIDPGFDIPPPG